MTYIAANLRDEDRKELLCQMPEGTGLTEAAHAMFEAMMPGFCWTASLDGTPACAFGYQAFSTPVWIAWAWGTRRMVRTIPAITPFMLAQGERLITLGCRRVEARTLQGHTMAQAWLTRLGCSKRCDLEDFGRDGETFELWAWALSTWRGHAATGYRKEHQHVLLDTETTAPAEDPQTTEGAEQGQRHEQR